MATEKDRLGDKLREVEKGREDEYFTRRDRELIAKLREEKDKETADALRGGATMRCPRCGAQMTARTEHEVHMEECPACGGLWLDKSDFETLARREEEGWFGRLFRARQSDPA
jgi:uncharacterized protein